MPVRSPPAMEEAPRLRQHRRSRSPRSMPVDSSFRQASMQASSCLVSNLRTNVVSDLHDLGRSASPNADADAIKRQKLWSQIHTDVAAFGGAGVGVERLCVNRRSISAPYLI